MTMCKGACYQHAETAFTVESSASNCLMYTVHGTCMHAVHQLDVQAVYSVCCWALPVVIVRHMALAYSMVMTTVQG